MKYKVDKNGYYRHREQYQGINIDVRSKDLAELEYKVRQKKNEIDDGYDAVTSSMKVNKWSEIWLETYKKGKISKGNYDTYERNLRLHILPYIGNKGLKDVLPIDLQMILNRQEGRSSSHICHVKNALTGMFRQARHNNLISRDPCEGLVVPQGSEGTHRALTSEEERHLFSVCEKGHRATPLVYLMYYAGLRPQEVAALKVADVNLITGYIYIDKAAEMPTGILKDTKSNAGTRKVPICNKLNRFLTSYLKDMNKDENVIVGAKGNPLKESSLRALWKSLRRSMSISMGAKVYRNKVIDSPLAEDFVPYNLRHTYCTNLQRAGIPINVAKYLMGHDDIKVTAKIYTHFTDDQADSVLEKLNIYLK